MSNLSSEGVEKGGRAGRGEVSEADEEVERVRRRRRARQHRRLPERENLLITRPFPRSLGAEGLCTLGAARLPEQACLHYRRRPVCASCGSARISVFLTHVLKERRRRCEDPNFRGKDSSVPQGWTRR